MPRSDSSGFGRKRTNSGRSDSGKKPFKKSSSRKSDSGGEERSSRRPSSARGASFSRSSDKPRFSKSDSERSDKKPFRGGRPEGDSKKPFRARKTEGAGGRGSGFKKFGSAGAGFRKSNAGGSEERPRRSTSFGDRKAPFKKYDSDKPRFRKSDGDSSEERPRRSSSFGDRKAPFKKYESDKPRFRKSDGDSSEERPRRSSSFGDRKAPFKKSEADKPRFRKSDGDASEERPRRSSSFGDRKAPFKKSDGDKPRFRKSDGDASEERPRRSSSFGDRKAPFKKSDADKPRFRKSDSGPSEERPRRSSRNSEDGGEYKSFAGKRAVSSEGKRPRRSKDVETSHEAAPSAEKVRLNKFIANSGVCSRREADELITMGLISVNGKTITELGYKVNPADEVRYESKVLRSEKNVYILMNKPKGFLTTTSDPQERNTVMHIIGNVVKERIYPVGRLDRNTTGLLLLTNDGDLAEKLMHPSYNAKKIYKAELDRPFAKADLDRIIEGVQLEEGKAIVDDVAIVSDDRKTVGLEIHIGWNRVVRRIFEALDYEVVKLDRTVYAGLDKKDLPRGHWRHLDKEEIIRLKHLQKG